VLKGRKNNMSKSYKEMNINELIDEIARVKEMLVFNKKPLTQKQNRKYLAKLENEYYEYVNNRKNDAKEKIKWK
jgi:hypothetical protein